MTKILGFRVDVQGVSKEAKKIASIEKQLAALNKERREALSLQKKGEISLKSRNTTLAKITSKTADLRAERTRLNKIENQSAKQYNTTTGSINQLRIRMTRLREEMRSLNLETTKGRARFKQLNGELQKGTTRLRGFDRQMSGSKTLVGEYGRGITSAFKGLAASFIGITALFRILRSTVSILQKFDSASAKLASITGKTRNEIADLTKQAKQLGAVTEFTANQVTELQIELAKLGFVSNEIKAATPAILSFATATGADLAAAAKTAGAAVRVFGLNASETEDAVATLAVATTKSGLTFAAFDTILSTAGPVAKAYGFTLEDIIALTGELATAGFEANKAATATRNILLKLADSNGELAKSLGGSVDTFDGLIDGLIKLDKEGISLNETLGITDVRSVAAFSRFLEGAESARTLRNGITDVNVELQEMVDKQLDTLAGDIKLLTSAWEGFVLKANTGPIRAIVQLLTNAAIQVSNLDLAIKKFNKQTPEQLERSFVVLQSLTNKQGEQFQAVLDVFSEKTAVQLEERKDDIINAFADIRKVNKKEAEALFNELVRQRKVEFDIFVQAEIDKNNRITELAESNARKVAKREIENLNTLNAQISELKESRKEASIDEIGAIELEIAAIEKKIEKFNEFKKLIDLLEELDIEASGFLDEEDQEAIIVSQDTFWKDLFASQEDLNRERIDQIAADNDAARAAEIEAEEELAEAKKRVEDDIRDHKLGIANESFAVIQGLNDRRLKAVDKQLKQEVISEEEADEQKRKIRRQGAFIDRTQALFNIALNTLVGVSNAASKVITLPLIPLIITLGAVQAAAVLATPIPEFAFGGKVQQSDSKGGRVKPGKEMSRSTPQGDNTLVLAKPGELFLNESQQAALGGSNTFKRIGVPGFAAGGAVGVTSPDPGSGIADMTLVARMITNSLNAQRVILNVNELNAAEDDLAVINQTNEL